MIYRFIGNYLIVLGVAIFLLAISGNMLALLNVLVASSGALAVVIGSFASYKRMIESQIATTDEDAPDVIDAIEDPFDLYEEEDNPKKKITTNIKEKASFVKNSFTPFRLFGYLVLVVGFFLLDGSGKFLAIAYLAGFLILPISALVFWFRNRK